MTEATPNTAALRYPQRTSPAEYYEPNEKLVVANDDSTLHRNVVGRSGGNTDESLVNIRKPTYESVATTIVETSGGQ